MKKPKKGVLIWASTKNYDDDDETNLTATFRSTKFLLAPTGALIVIVCYCISGHFLRFWAFLPIYIEFHFEIWMFYYVLWCSRVFFDVLWCSLMFYDVLWCSMIFYDVLWCSKMFYDVLWCSMMFYVLRAFLVSLCRSVPPEFLRSFLKWHRRNDNFLFKLHKCRHPQPNRLISHC